MGAPKLGVTGPMQPLLSKEAEERLQSIRARVQSDWRAARERLGLCPIAASSVPVAVGFASETEQLLRSRLRAVSFILFLAFAAFLSVYLDPRALSDPLLYFWHATITVVMAVCSIVLCERYNWRLPQLRRFEYLIFGLPAAFFVYLQFLEMNLICHNCQVIASPDLLQASASQFVIPWICVIFIYASFIPNTWQRCAAHVVPLAIVPIVLFVVAALQVPGGTELLWGRPILMIVLWLAIPTFTGIFGAHTFHALRKRAVMARELGSYHLKERLGEGGMGEVYLGEHKFLKRPCAIKLIRPNQASDPRAIARFEVEVQATARLTHWNTIEIYDYGHTEDGTFYYAMEYLPGMSLQQLVDEYGPMPTERAVHFLRQVCDGLREAHGMGLIHRDIKPGNIFATSRGGIWDVAKLLDFGLVKSIGPTASGEANASSDGLVVGTPLFAAPEWTLREGRLDERSDIYSLGAVAYFLVTGRPVFNHKSPVKLLFAHANEPVTPMREFQPDVPADFEAVIFRCLAKQPEDRFSSVEDLATALDACACREDWTQRMAVEWWRLHESGRIAASHAADSDPSAATQVLEIAEA